LISGSLNSATIWDKFALGSYAPPDVYVEVTLGSAVWNTSTKDNTYLPTWNELIGSASAAAIMGSNLTFVIKDDDTVTSEVIGTCVTTIPQSLLTGGQVLLLKNCNSEVLEIEFKFTEKI
jgi:hypothetical protein